MTTTSPGRKQRNAAAAKWAKEDTARAANWIMDDYRLNEWSVARDSAVRQAAQMAALLRAWREDDDPVFADFNDELCRYFALAKEPPRGERSLLAAVYEDRPQRPDTKRPDPILPAIRWTGEAPEREAGRRLFGPLRADLEAPRQPSLFYREAPEALVRRVPLLALSDAAGRQVMAQGRGAPLAFRIPVEAALSVSLKDHDSDGSASVRIANTVREWRDGLFPGGWRPGPTGNRPGDLARLRAALQEADSCLIPWGRDGLGFWRMFALRGDPGPSARLDDLVIVDVALPPGSGSGPVIDRPKLRALGVESGPRYRAYLAVHGANWIVGGARGTRVPNSKTGRYGWSADRTRYPVFTLRDRRELAFGTADEKNRTRAEVDAPFEGLPGIAILGKNEEDTRTGASGWRIVPEEAANAIQRAEAQRAGRQIVRADLRNRGI